MRRFATRLLGDEAGGALVETTVMLTITFIFVLGSVDFLMAMYQWNAAAKAVEIGARIAAVSSPVDSSLSTLTGIDGSHPAGTAPPASFATRTCDGTGSCSGGGSYSASAMNVVVFGRSSLGACGSGVYCTGMNNIFPRIQPQNVVVSYADSGLGYAGRPGGPVPTITVSLQNLPFQFFFLGGLMGFANLQIQSVTTMTGEDLSSSAPTT
jgi:Flp pilus assembly protein TadG